MLSFRTQQKLANTIQLIAENERKLEVVRQVVAEQKSFEPYTAFKRIDRNRNGVVRIDDLERFLNDNDVFLSSKELFNVFKFFDIDSDGRITYNDFIREVLPQEDLALRELCTLRKSYQIGLNEFLPYEVEWALARVFTQLADNYRQLENARQQLSAQVDFNLRDAFNDIDSLGRGFITVGQIETFLNNCYVSISNEELNALFRVVDLDSDGRIQYKEFVEIILPSEPYSRYLARSIERSASRLNRSQNLEQSNLNRSYTQSQKSKRLQLLQSMEEDQDEYYRYLVKKQAQMSGSKMESPKSSGIYRSGGLSRSRYESPAKNLTMNQSPRRNLNYSPNRSFNASQSIRLNQSASRNRNTPSKLSRSIVENELTYSKYQSPRNQRLTSPMRGAEEVQLVQALKQQVQTDRDIEELKKKLALRADFNLLDGFRIFDMTGRGYLTSTELEEQLNNLGLYPSKDEVYLFFRRYDKDQDGLIRYSDFCKIVSPQSSEYANILKERVPLYQDVNQTNDLTLETRRIMRQLFNLCINGETQAEAVRQRLARRPYFNAHEAFSALDKNDNGFITFDEFQQLLADYGFFTSHTDLVNLVQRYDKNQDGRISYGEFVNELMPKSPQKY